MTGPVPAAIERALHDDFDLIPEPAGADGVLALLTTPVDAPFLDRAGRRLRVVANFAVGVDNVDLAAAHERGVVVANTPDVLTHATAELAITLTLTLLRRVAEGDRLIRAGGQWGFGLDFMLGASLEGKRFVVVGPGRIGRETARLAEGLGARARFAGRGDDLHAAAAAADVLSLHCPLEVATRHMIDASVLAAMRPTAVLVNTARGAIVDERALIEALQSGTIAGAALDVFENEPDVPPELIELENVVLSPHLGSATRETREAMGMLAVSALRAVLVEGRVPPNVVRPSGL